jgi:hypothetical protein
MWGIVPNNPMGNSAKQALSKKNSALHFVVKHEKTVCASKLDPHGGTSIPPLGPGDTFAVAVDTADMQISFFRNNKLITRLDCPMKEKHCPYRFFVAPLWESRVATPRFGVMSRGMYQFPHRHFVRSLDSASSQVITCRDYTPRF